MKRKRMREYQNEYQKKYRKTITDEQKQKNTEKL